MNLPDLIEYLSDTARHCAGDGENVTIVHTADDYTDDGEFIALDQIPLDSGGGGF